MHFKTATPALRPPHAGGGVEAEEPAKPTESPVRQEDPVSMGPREGCVLKRARCHTLLLGV